MPSSSNAALTGALLALGATVGWSGNFLFSRMLAGQVPPFTLILLRCLVAMVVFTPFALKAFRKSLPIFRDRPFFYIFLALAGLGYFNALIYLAGQTSSVINMSLLATLSPIFTILLSRVFLGEALSIRKILGILTAVAGVVLLTTKGDLELLRHFTFHAGDLFMLGSSLMFASYSVGLRFKSPALDNNAMILSTFVISTVFLIPIAAWELLVSGQTIAVTPASVTGVLYTGIVASVLCYWCWTNAITRVGPGIPALIYYTIPLFAGIEAVIFLGEPVFWVHFAGGGLIIAGVLLATRK